MTIPDGIHPRAAALQRPPPVSAPLAEAPVLPYSDDAAYLGDQLLRIRALLEARQSELASDDAAAASQRSRAAALELTLRQRVQVSDRRPGLEQLQQRFDLDPLEVDVLLHAALPLIEPGLLRLYSRISGHAWPASQVDVGTVLQLHFPDVAQRLRALACFAPGATLRRHRLLVLQPNRTQAQDSLLSCTLALTPQAAALVFGQALDGAQLCAHLITPTIRLDDVLLEPEVRTDLAALAAALPPLDHDMARGAASADPDAPAKPAVSGAIVLVTGPPGTGKTMLAHALAHHLERRLLVVDPHKLRDTAGALEEQLADAFDLAHLQQAAVLLDDCELVLGARTAGNRTLGPVLDILDRFTGLIVLATNLPERLDPALDRRVLLRVDLAVPHAELRRQIWAQHLLAAHPLVPAAPVDLVLLGKRYDFSGGYIRNAVRLAVARALARPGPAALTQDDLEAAALAQLRGDLADYTERSRSTLSLDALVLPTEVKAQLMEIIAAGKNRNKVLHGWGFGDKLHTGKGQVVLLSGEPGTGKTLSAEVIAAELGMSLYRINPAKVVSKYVGETEKNLNEILAQAKSVHAILFFDEADALFATRVQRIESANDRFVNLETNFLLQQLERYEGLVILATNLETSIDQAFKRRIHYHVVVPFPAAAARAAIWRGLLPERAPLASDVDFVLLGKAIELSGGHIKNAVMRAAYVAAQQDIPISMALLLDAAEKECAAAGKLFQHIAPAATRQKPR